MSEADRLTLAYAERYPDECAARIAQAPRPELFAFLGSLPAGVAVRVAARLPVSGLRDVISGMADELIGWMPAARFDDSITLLTRLSREEQGGLIRALDDRMLRRRLRQTLNFPAHSVGALAVELPLQVSADMALETLLMTMRESQIDGRAPVVVLENERYAGIIDPWRLALQDGGSLRTAEACMRVKPINPEMSLDSARSLPQWQQLQWLPVIDQEQRPLGYVTRAQIMGLNQRSGIEAEVVRESVFDLSLRYFHVLGELLERLLVRSGSGR